MSDDEVIEALTMLKNAYHVEIYETDGLGQPTEFQLKVVKEANEAIAAVRTIFGR